ncbi:Sensor protein ChvG [uncultured Alphaproteobacteria bacterium]|uniref:histidine kinase n=1 Tax=uncultured Alphaproteobacteria bacterium TaxID=91750 RepID=A0A212KK02_9PROT|nr:Sensor protein ChvG [uncultured Alphaproteobacteria bacterium]
MPEDVLPSEPSQRRERWVSPLTRKILAVNLLAPVLLVLGALYLDAYEQGLLRSELESLRAQGEMVAAAVAESAVSGEFGGRTLSGNNMTAAIEGGHGYRLLPEQARHMVRRLSVHAGRRVRLFDARGELLADSRYMFVSGGIVEVSDLPPPRLYPAADRLLREFNDRLVRLLGRVSETEQAIPPYVEAPLDPIDTYEELGIALRFGETSEAVRRGEHAKVLGVAVPVQYYKQVVGAVLINDSTDSVEANVFQVRKAILRLFLSTLGVTILLSWYQAGTIIHPVRRLARAAQAVQSGLGTRNAIPNLSRRGDEIGDLSVALGQMTETLWDRIEATERFAADVAHEIKNPLTSMRSAVETVSRIDDADNRRRLLAIIAEDVQRIDRLISDVADMSRVDAELMKATAVPLNLGAMLSALIEVETISGDADGVRFSLQLQEGEGLWVLGSEGRLVQVFRNLIGNAVSFSPPEGLIVVRVRTADTPQGAVVVVEVDDEGPGIPEGKEDAIFDRFYSERPAGEKFGTHSGLGLAISKQIVQGLGGRIGAVNRRDLDDPGTPGARFVLTLPRLMPPYPY